MRRNHILLPTVIAFLTIFSACKKDKEFKPEEVRLKEVRTVNDGKTFRTFIEYDAAGRITRVDRQVDDEPRVTDFDVIYFGNEIILIDDPVSNVNTEIRDSIRFLLNADKTVSKRIAFTYFEVKGPTYPPQRTYTYDTTSYQYDAAGLILKEIRSIYDSTWFNNGAVTTTSYTTSGVAVHTIDQGKLVSVNYSSNTSIVGRTPTNIYLYNTSSTKTQAFEYADAFPNKTDFSNAAILNELYLFSALPMIGKYTLLPSKYSSTSTDTDPNGTVTSSDSYTRNYQFRYNLYGFVSKSWDPANPNVVQNYIYTF